jgi:hypothetical protein
VHKKSYPLFRGVRGGTKAAVPPVSSECEQVDGLSKSENIARVCLGRPRIEEPPFAVAWRHAAAKPPLDVKSPTRRQNPLRTYFFLFQLFNSMFEGTLVSLGSEGIIDSNSSVRTKGIPKEREVDSRREVCEWEGWVYDREGMGTSSMWTLTDSWPPVMVLPCGLCGWTDERFSRPPNHGPSWLVFEVIGPPSRWVVYYSG